MRLRWICRAPGLYTGWIKGYSSVHLFDIWQHGPKEWYAEYRVTNHKMRGDTLKVCKELAQQYLDRENPVR